MHALSQYQEMGWLTGGVEATPEASVAAQGGVTIGEQIFPALDKEDLVEFNRTAVGILTLHWVMNGDYESFTACQAEPTRLTQGGFAQLQTYTKSILKTPEDFNAMETFMVINDLGKVKSIVGQIAERTGTQDVDHDKVLLVGLENSPEISPSFQKLSPEHKEMILNGLRTKFNIGQFIQGENVPASLDGLGDVDQQSLKFYLLHALYDIAGAAGQAVQNGSVIMNEPTYGNFQLAIGSLEKIGEGQTSDVAYDAYLAGKGEQLGLDTQIPGERESHYQDCLYAPSFKSGTGTRNITNLCRITKKYSRHT